MAGDASFAERRRQVFIAALVLCGVVARVVASVGTDTGSAYRLRERVGAEGFAAAWDRALDEGQAHAIDAAMAAAMDVLTDEGATQR